MSELDRNHPAFKRTAEPFFNIVMQGLAGMVEGEHFWDVVDEDAVFEFSYRFPGLSQTLNGRAAYMEWFSDYPNILSRADLLQVYKDPKKHAVILDYEVHGTAPTGKEYHNRFCSIVRVENKKIVHWIDFADTYSAALAMQPEGETPVDFLELAKERFSVRKFSDRPVEKKKLDKILEAGNVAPTAVNYQPQRIYVLQSEDALTKVNSVCKCIYGARTVLMFTYDENKDWKNPKEPGNHSGQQDVSIVATHIMLEAWNLGIGSCWVNLFSNAELEKTFALPQNERTVLLMPLGYAAEGTKPNEKWHFGCKELSETVTYL